MAEKKSSVPLSNMAVIVSFLPRNFNWHIFMPIEVCSIIFGYEVVRGPFLFKNNVGANLIKIRANIV